MYTDRMRVLYATGNIPGDNRTLIITTSENVWNQCQCVDDNDEGYDYTRIEKAMEASGTVRVMESTYALKPTATVQSVLQSMTNLGFDMVSNQAFTQFVKSTT